MRRCTLYGTHANLMTSTVGSTVHVVILMSLPGGVIGEGSHHKTFDGAPTTV